MARSIEARWLFSVPMAIAMCRFFQSVAERRSEGHAFGERDTHHLANSAIHPLTIKQVDSLEKTRPIYRVLATKSITVREFVTICPENGRS